MRISWNAITVLSLFVGTFTTAVSIQIAAQELPQCFVESIPCVNAKVFRELLQRCVRDPRLCQIVKRIPVQQPDRPRVLSAERSGAEATTPAGRRASPAAGVGSTQSGLAKPQEPGRLSGSGTSEAQNHTASALARELPLDPATTELADALPADAAAVERRLGLRRPSVAGEDMRGQTPSPEDFVRALAPRQTSQ